MDRLSAFELGARPARRYSTHTTSAHELAGLFLAPVDKMDELRPSAIDQPSLARPFTAEPDSKVGGASLVKPASANERASRMSGLRPVGLTVSKIAPDIRPEAPNITWPGPATDRRLPRPTQTLSFIDSEDATESDVHFESSEVLGPFQSETSIQQQRFSTSTFRAWDASAYENADPIGQHG